MNSFVLAAAILLATKNPVHYDPYLKIEDRKILREAKIKEQTLSAIAFYNLRFIQHGPADSSDDTED